MTQAPQEASTSKHLGLAIVAAGLMVLGMFEAATAYGFWGNWAIAAVALTAGSLCFVWVARAEARLRSWTRPPLWLVVLGVTVVLAAVLFGLLAAVCGDDSGFSCGG